MRVVINSTLSAYRTPNSSVLVVLGLIIGQCFCLPMLGEIHHTPTLAEGVGSEIHENHWSALTLKQLGSTISGQRAGPDGGPSKIHQVPEAILAPDLPSALENEVLKPLEMLTNHEVTGFTQEATEALSLHIAYLDKFITEYMRSPTNPNLPGARIASDFLQRTETVMEILRTSKSTFFHIDKAGAPRKILALDHLNEALVRFLIIFERHNLASPEWLKDLLNKEKGVEIIFNYVARRFPGLRDHIDVTSAYLITDFKKALQESPFTAELKKLLEYFDRPGWHRLEHLHISSQLSAFERSFDPEVIRAPVYSFPPRFMELTKAGWLDTDYRDYPDYQADIKTLISSVVHQIYPISMQSSKINRSHPSIKIVSLKILHSMLRFLARYHIYEGPTEEGRILPQLTESMNVVWLEEFDRTIILFSDTLKTIYLDYGESMQDQDLIWEIDKSIPMIYLTDIIDTQPWIFSARRFGLSIDAQTKRNVLKYYPQLPLFAQMTKNILEHLATTANLESRDRLRVMQGILLHPESYINA
ncbi:hypothetical protein PtA15_8A731 [Puccinia triticina]|uniref:Exocyst complex component Sec6 n=1 Tax=Puccinia triticina TaxID=208348 RepID=A0ABY7CRC5_9BASI|nr:uncharacterized protein PtA15_8A731 [Puccinia triticina]WAQ87824.1 hypothetical protein PtA15_8A731 [Puccinia triticina]